MLNEKFGKLIVLAAAGKNRQNRLLWLCGCECGKELVVRSDSLRNGRTKSCGRCDLVEIVPGLQFGRWIVLEGTGTDRSGNRRWLCRCLCPKGTEKSISARALRLGTSKSCGCLHSEIASATAKQTKRRHGHRSSNGTGKQSRAYTAWINMKERCKNPEKPQWKDWGGRGITYDPHWEAFEHFFEDMGEPPEGMSLDRIDNDGNYCRDNCCWTDRDTQRRNSRQVHHVLDQDGELLVLKDFAKKHNLPYSVIPNRIWRGWSLEEAVKFEVNHG